MNANLERAIRCVDFGEDVLVGCLRAINPEKAKSLHDRIKEEVIGELNKSIKSINYEIERL